ncbi:SMC-Scp complex subunit ScpB [Thermosipho ferrireducens]|uniref:SMC-Scp complex subunit ScpB n=1 Tax=Thermosipho ferrireducens TaxID=2571116 RepID=A0ABX7S837_9BACT|nr:SMC-Scp complex subunit ScpB [Thermosipho ferrireducens]QTA38757.1 SMC-Scp complex subunit ScpB [Thermosipho ferrireducens]
MDKKLIAMVEAIIFASRGIEMEKVRQLVDCDFDTLDRVIRIIQEKYKDEAHGIELKIIDGFLRFYAKKDYAKILSKVVKRRSLHSLTESQLEIVLLLASNKKMTKSELDNFRGKDSYAILKQLLSNGVVKRRKKGRSYIYSLTETFRDETMIDDILSDIGGVVFDSSGSKVSFQKNNGER